MHKLFLLLVISPLILGGCGYEEVELERCDNIDVPAVYYPLTSNDKNIILHNGHGTWNCAIRDTAIQFTEAGYTVYTAEMPPEPHNRDKDFMGATRTLVDKLRGTDIYMVGLSGGGFTTTMATAIFPEIIKGYSVAGDHPVESLLGMDNPDKHWEVVNSPVSLSDAYELAGGRLFHIYNYYDTCCYKRVTGDIGIPYATDYTHQSHIISKWTVQYILDDIDE